MKTVWIALLGGFAALNVYAITAGDWAGLVDYLGNLGPWGTLGTVDLLIGLSMAVAFMWRDARSKGINPIPYAVLTVLTGSIGVLVYLVRFWDRARLPVAGRSSGQTV